MKLSLNKTKISWQRFFAAAMLFMLLFFMLRILAPLRWQDLYNTYGLCAIAALAGLYFAKRGFGGPAEIKIFTLFALWLLLSRWLNGDVYLFIDFELVMFTLLAVLLFAAGSLLDKKERSLLLDALSLIYVGFNLVTALAGIFVFLTNTYIHIPPENVWISILNEGGLNSLNALSTHRLLAVVRFFISACLVVYQIIKRKNILVRIILVLCYLALHLAIALCHGRTAQIAMSGGFAMLMLLVFMPRLEKKAAAVRLGCLAAVALLSLLLCYKSFDACDILVSKLQSVGFPAFEEYYNSLEAKPNEEYFGIKLTDEELAALNSEAQEQTNKANEEAAAEPEATPAPKVQASVVDKRSVLGNWTFTGRTEIWESCFILIREDPSILLRGRSGNNMMDDVNRILQTQVNPNVKEYKNHMHNSFMQVLMLCGLPGLLLMLAWTVLMVKNMFKVFFSKSHSLEVKFLTVPIASFFVISLAEIYLFASLDSVSMAFYLIAGVFLAEAKGEI